ncbi:MAG: response regulator transcription factor [Alistipes sp.]|nr:response regulator transcription factor [Alistipes sp.]
MKRYRVVVIEPSELIVEGLRAMLLQSEFDVVAHFADIKSCVEKFTAIVPDVVVAGSQVIGTFKRDVRYLYPELQSVALSLLSTTVCDDECVRWVDSVINVYDDRVTIARKLNQAVEQSQTNPYTDSHELSEREQDVLILLAKGLTNKEVAERLYISIHTVNTHRKNISHKTGIKSVAGLTIYAILHNLLDPAEVEL